MKYIKLLSVFLFIFILHTAFAQSVIDTTWSGNIEVLGTKIGIITYFKTENGALNGTMDIPEQSAMGMELSKVSFSNPNIHFELQGSSGIGVFEGIYFVDSISGTFSQSGINGRFRLVKGLPENNTTQPVELDYNSEEVTFTNDGNTFAGTLTYPKTEGKHPAVVLITGSGAQNRDENITGFKIFRVIAEYLTQNGIAVLRYDDRGVGGTTGKTVDQSTTEDFAGDVIAAVQYLKTRDDINPSQIGLLGHSEGGIVAPIAAGKSGDIAFIILMAGTGVKGIDIVMEQTELIMKAGKSKDEEIEGYLKMLEAVYEAMKNKRSLDDIKKQIKNDIIENFENIPEKQRKNITNKEQYATDAAEKTIAEFDNPWMRFFLQYDPQAALAKVKCPVLVLFGEKDLQVPPKQSLKPIENALKKGENMNYKVVVFPDANHLFQKARTGSPAEYGTLPKEFVPDFLETISSWILERVTIVK